MKRILVFIFFVVFVITCKNNISQNRIVLDKKTNNKILIGYCNREGLKSEPFDDWFNSEYGNYIVDTLSLDSISKGKLDYLKITIIMGTWCGDSRREVPRFYKIIDNLHFREQNITLINVDRKMKANDIDIEKFSVSRIPTFVFSIDNKEIGRIIETPKKSLEKDLMEIVSIN